MTDPTGQLLAELRADGPLVAECTVGRIWAGEKPELVNGVALPPDARPYVILRPLIVAREPRNPKGLHRYVVQCVHKTPRDAKRLYGLVSDVLHDKGPRTSATKVGIWHSYEDPGSANYQVDPSTFYPYWQATYSVFAATLAVA